MQEENKKSDAAFLIEHKKELDDLFECFVNEINPFIMEYEVLTNEFPVAILNEIRAIFTHLARISLSDDERIAKVNIEKMQSHIKRAKLDGFKYSCMAVKDVYNQFFETYKEIDFSYINEGEFLYNLRENYMEANVLLLAAKKAEGQKEADEAIYKLYEDAHIRFAEVKASLDNATKDADYLQKKAATINEREKRAYAYTVAGVIIGIAGIVIGILVAILL